MEPTWNSPALMSSTVFGEHQTSPSAEPTHIHCQAWWWRGGDVGLVCSHSAWVPGSDCVVQKLLCKLEYSREKCQAICLSAAVWLKLGQVAEQWSEEHFFPLLGLIFVK